MKNKSLKICFSAFVFLLAFSVGAQLARSQIELQDSPVTRYLRENYGVNSIEEYRAKLEQEAWLNYTNFIKQFSNEEWFNDSKQRLPETNQYGTSTYQPLPIQAQTYPLWVNLTNVNPFVELSVFSMSGISFLTMLLIPKFGRKLLQKKWLIAIVIVAFTFYAGFMVGKTIAQSSFPPNLYFDSLPSTANYVVETDGTYVWATRSDGKIAYGGANNAGGVSGTNASAVIQSAINALTPGRTWKEKVIIKGNYENVGQITIPSYTIFELLGSIKAKAALNTHVIQSTGTTNIEITGGYINANKEQQTESMNGIYLYQVQTFSVHDIKVRGAFRKGAPDFPGETHGENICVWDCHYGSVHDCYVLESVYDGIKVRGGSTHILVTNNICVNSEYKGGIQVSSEGTKYIAVVGNLIYQNYHEYDNGIRIHTADNVLVIANQVYCYNSTAIQLIDNAQENVIQGNNIVTNTCGIHTFANTPSTARPTYNFFKDNTIILGTATGASAIAIDNGYYNEITGNVIRGTGSGVGIKLGSSYVLGNKIFRNTITNVATPISNSGSGTIIKQNDGYVTESSGTATITASTSVTVNHGLAGTPTVVTVTPRQTGYGMIAVTARNSTTFTITVTTSGTYDIDWYAEYQP